jgi:predicted Zn finger-like uncharacterized protein
MDVTCERCSTAYEFDDALVSERGTTVKCTNCGHQFKVRRPQAAGAPERWLVRTIDGREIEFRALRELQAAIAQAAITRDDVLSRGGSRPRRLGSIAELEPFFVSAGAGGPTHSTSLGLGPRAPVITGLPTPAAEIPSGRSSQPSSPGPAPRAPAEARVDDPAQRTVADRSRVTTAHGIGMPRTSEVSVAIPLPRGPEPFSPAASARRPAEPPLPPRRPGSIPPAGALPGVIVAPAGAPPVPVPAVDDAAIYEENTRAVARPEEEPTAVRPSRPRAPVDDVSRPTAPFQISALLDPAKVRAAAQHEDWTADENVDGVSGGGVPPQNQHTASVPPLAPSPSGAGVRHSYADDLLEPRFSQAAAPPTRPGAARWIVGMVVVGMLALAFATVGRKMLVPGASPQPVESDARIAGLLADGEKSLAEGDLESAKEQFDKASVLGERDPRAVADLARLLSTRGDIEWLRVRLLPDGDPEQASAQRELEQAAQRARKAADHAAEVAPADIAVLRSRVDALRLSGDLGGARKLVGGGISTASVQPDNALTLAELGLAEAQPDWTTVLERLRKALSSDGNLGRARSMLVYALARSHPLVTPLRAFLARSGGTDLPGASASAKPAHSAAPGGGTARPLEPPVKTGPAAPPNRDRPPPPEPRPPPADHVVTPSGEHIDTSDLPGVHAPAAPVTTGSPGGSPPPAHTSTPAPAPTPVVPPGVDTSDLPGFK